MVRNNWTSGLRNGWALVLGGLVALVGCESFTNCEKERNCAVADGGAGGEGGVARVEPEETNPGGAGESAGPGGATGCVSTGRDEPDAAGVDENCDGIDGDAERAVFVSPRGDDGASGSRKEPFASLTHAVTVAVAEDKDVFVCSGRYEQALTLEDVDDDVRFFGGYDCERGWGRTETPVELAPTTGIVLDIRDSSGRVEFSRFRFVAPDATTPGGSSIAGRVLRSKDVRFSEVEFEAGAGAAGVDGVPALVYETGAPAGLTGTDAPLASTFDLTNCYTYDSACVTRCKSGCTGIACGLCDTAAECRVLRSTTDCQNRYDRSRTLPVAPSGTVSYCPTDDGGTIPVSFVRGGMGGNGVRQPTVAAQPGSVGSGTGGAHGAPGAAASVGFGTLTADGDYVATNGGTRGRFGQVGNAAGLHGGAGGSATYLQADVVYGQIGGSGGSAGKPGCGGHPGQPGGGGGASIALLSLDSSIRFDGGALTAGSGGSGGTPSAGGSGQVGGRGGVGGYGSRNRTTRTGGTGTDGTRGGRGGAGGAGAGGPSIALLFAGAEPSLEGVTRKIGSGGAGGSPVDGGRTGAAGLAVESYEVSLP